MRFISAFFRTLLALTLALGPLARAGTLDNLPDLGDDSAALISPQQERQLGENFMRQARQVLRFDDDPEINEYLNTLGAKLVRAAGLQARDFHFFIVDDKTLNAFAVPGGFIGVHSGMILQIRSESELAAILSHEIAHIKQRHIPRMMADAQRLSGPALAAMLAGLLLAGSQGQGAEASLAMTTAGLQQHELNFSRQFEREADRIGIHILWNAGYDPRAMAEAFERLQSWARLNEGSVPEFLRDHPVTADRIAEARDRAARLGHHPPTDNRNFLIAQARLRALTGEPAETANYFDKTLGQTGNTYPNALRYGYAVALLRANHAREALAQAQTLHQSEPNRLSFDLLTAQCLIAGGEINRGLTEFAAARKAAPASKAVLEEYARALIEHNRSRQAYALLKPVLRTDQHDALLYRLYGQAAGDAGALVDAHRALAEYYYLNGNTGVALEQLRIARRYAGKNFYAVSSIEAREKEIKDQAALWTTSG